MPQVTGKMENWCFYISGSNSIFLYALCAQQHEQNSTTYYHKLSLDYIQSVLYKYWTFSWLNKFRDGAIVLKLKLN